MKRTLGLSLFALILAATAVGTAAADITIGIEAVVVTVDDPSNLLAGQISVGDAVTGEYTYGAEATDSNSAVTVGDYEYASSPYGISVTAESLVFSTDPDHVEFLVEICDNHGTPASDNYLLRSYKNLPLPSGVPVNLIAWQLDGLSLAALSSAALTAHAPNLGDWTSVLSLTIEGGDPYGGQFRIGAIVTTAVVKQIALRIQAIRLADDDGGRAADTTAAEFSQWIDFANVSFAPAGIAFSYDPATDFAEVRSTFLNNIADPNDTFPDWRAQGAQGNEIAARYPGKVLVLMRHGPGPTSDYGGSGSPSHGFIILPGFGVSIHCGTPAFQWFAHEMGHFIGLDHTMPNLPAFADIAEAAAYFVANGRTASVFDGDGLSDTLPDPYMRFLECATTTSVTLDGIAFELPRSNLMSYYREASVITPMQAAIARSMAELVVQGGGRYPTNVAAAELPTGALRFEAEDLAYVYSGAGPGEQDMAGFTPYPFSPRWSQDKQLYWGAGSGNWVTLYVNVPATRRYGVFAYATLSPYFDTVSVEIDGKATGATLDAYAPQVLPSGPIQVSSGIELAKGVHQVRFTVIGTNSASLGHGFGIDCIELRP